jgi:hypothetical protein
MKNISFKPSSNNTNSKNSIGMNAPPIPNKKSLAAFPTRHPLIQAKIKIGQPNDKYEQEADRVADQVMRILETKRSSVNGYWSLGKGGSESPLLQRQSEECPEGNKYGEVNMGTVIHDNKLSPGDDEI